MHCFSSDAAASVCSRHLMSRSQLCLIRSRSTTCRIDVEKYNICLQNVEDWKFKEKQEMETLM